MTKLDRRKYWITVAHELYGLGVLVGGGIWVGWAFSHAINDRTRTALRFGMFWGLVILVIYLIEQGKAIAAWQKGSEGLIEILYRRGAEHRRASRVFTEPPRAEGRYKTFIAWFTPIVFGTPALLLAAIIPLIAMEPGRLHPLRDGAILMVLPISILGPIAWLINKSGRMARDQRKSLTEVLYEWHRKVFQVNPAKRMSESSRVSKGQRRLKGPILMIVGAIAIHFDLINQLLPGSRPYGQIIHLLLWIMVIGAFGDFLRELRYDD